MNILFLTTHANTGGITSYILTLGETLVKSGHKVVVASSGGDCVPLMEKAGIRHVKINVRTKSEIHPKLFLSLPALIGLMDKEKIDIIHAQTRVTQVLGTVLSLLTGIPMVTTCHGFFKPRWFRKTFPCWGEGVIAVSRPVAQHLSADFGSPQDKIHLVSNGVDLSRFSVADENKHRVARQKIGIGNLPLIGIIARLSDVKGIDVLIKAMLFVIKEIPSANLMIVGQGPQEDNLKQLTRELSLTAFVHFQNITNHAYEILPAFDVFAMPSLMEGLGLSVMESQACGIPVVASRVGGLTDLIEDGDNGYLVDANDPLALAKKIIKVLRNPAQAKEITIRARAKIEQYFSAQMMAQKTLEVYEQYSHR